MLIKFILFFEVESVTEVSSNFHSRVLWDIIWAERPIFFLYSDSLWANLIHVSAAM